MSSSEMVLTVDHHPGNGLVYMACWSDGEPQVQGIPEHWLDLMPFMVARVLIAQGYDPGRLLVVQLRGADRDMCRAPLGAVAATPVANTAAPVRSPAHSVYRRPNVR
jgi:hypothetical protein